MQINMNVRNFTILIDSNRKVDIATITTIALFTQWYSSGHVNKYLF